MKKTFFAYALTTAGLLLSSCAFADHRSHGNGHQRYYAEAVYAEPVYIESRGYLVRESYDDYGRVLSARPIYRRVAVDVPRESCQVETYRRETRSGGDSFAGTVVGGLIGAAVGHEVGNGRGGATAVGGLIGASIGNDANKRRVVSYQDEEVCRTHYSTEYEQQLVGYDVSYSYLGRIYQTRTDRHPGDRIAVAVNVRTNGRY